LHVGDGIETVVVVMWVMLVPTPKSLMGQVIIPYSPLGFRFVLGLYEAF